MSLQTVRTLYDRLPPGLLEGRVQLHVRAMNQK